VHRVSNCHYKKFKTEAEALSFVAAWNANDPTDSSDEEQEEEDDDDDDNNQIAGNAETQENAREREERREEKRERGDEEDEYDALFLQAVAALEEETHQAKREKLDVSSQLVERQSLEKRRHLKTNADLGTGAYFFDAVRDSRGVSREATGGVESLSPEQRRALDIVLSGKNLLLVGEAGTGKSHLIRHMISALQNNGKTVFCTASTGVAASLIGATTLHAFCWTRNDCRGVGKSFG
jgi:flagellar biosynthesis GTPase FlhF